MILDAEQLAEDAELRADVGIVGAGVAGIDLARTLARRGVRVVLLESGREEFDGATQRLTAIRREGKRLREPDPEGGFTPYLDPVFRGETRIRQLGGTSSIWTGKWRMFDAIDFESRPWIPHSGWPIGLDELKPFYAQVAGDYGLGDFDGFARSNGELARALAPHGLMVSGHYWEREPVRPATRFRDELTGSGGLDVVIGANVTELVLTEDHTRIRCVVFRTLRGPSRTLVATHFVLAAGGLEVPRLLLASNRQLPPGIGNAHGLVGRFFMDHPKHKEGALHPGPAFALIGDRANVLPRPRFHVSVSLSEEAQRRQSLPNHAVYFRPVYRYQVDYPKERVAALRGVARAPGGALAAALALAASPGDVAKIVQRSLHRDRGGAIAHCALSMYLEQEPNRNSRVYLSTERDALGMPVLVVDWRLTGADEQRFVQLQHALQEACARSGIGRLDFGPRVLTLDDTVDAAHHMGTTRMAADANEGVVDPDCRVHGVENLFVSSSAVFPTGHSAAPTFTILALGRRLGEHLARLLRH